MTYYDPERLVGYESRKGYKNRIKEGFFDKYMQGFGIELAPQGYETDQIVPILPSAIPVDLSTAGYNGYELPVSDGSQDYIYSSHVLEHIEDYKRAIKAWHRALMVGGHIITIVPSAFLYERKLEIPTSLHNPDHKRAYTPASIAKEFEEALEVNSYRIRLLRDLDEGYDYSIPLESHPCGEYSIEIVVQKIKTPSWKIC
jgi:SAM-dependent methyltransferase